MDRPSARGIGHLRAAHRDVHGRGNARLGDRTARRSRRSGDRLRRAPAGQRVQRNPQLGVRRSALVCGARGLRRSVGLPALRRGVPPARSRRDPGRRVQPPGPERQLPAGVRALSARCRAEHVGLVGRPRRAGGATLHRRERSDVDAGPSRRRAATGCRARARGLVAPSHPDGARRADRRAERACGSTAHPHRRIRPQRCDAHLRSRGGRLRAWRRSGATTTTTPSTSR